MYRFGAAFTAFKNVASTQYFSCLLLDPRTSIFLSDLQSRLHSWCQRLGDICGQLLFPCRLEIID